MERGLYTYGVIVITAAIGIAGYELIGWRSLTATDWAAWVGAIGTLLAFGGTIWIASGERRFRSRQRRELAMIAAEAIKPVIYEVLNDFAHLICEMLPTNDPEDWGNPTTTTIEHFVAIKMWSNNDLLPLLPLPNQCASKLMRARTQIEGLQKYFDESQIVQRGVRFPDRSINMLVEQITALEGVLNSAFQTCHQASEMRAEFE